MMSEPNEIAINPKYDFRALDSNSSVRRGEFTGFNTPGKVNSVTRRRIDNKRIVPGIDNADVDIVLAAVHILWMMGSHKLPTVKEICDRAAQVDPDHVIKILAHKRFRTMCLARNIQWPDRWNEAEHNGAVLRGHLRPEQAQVLAIVLEPSRESFTAKLRKAGITAATWMGWLNEPMFAEAVRVSSENMLSASQASVHASVINGASSGNVQAQRLYYELTGRHDPAKQQMQDLNNVVRLLLEILTRHVTDPAILGKINSDLDRVMGGHNLKEIDVIPANYTVVDTTSDSPPVGSTIEAVGDEIPDGFFDMSLEDENE
jgi:hypothetical protein